MATKKHNKTKKKKKTFFKNYDLYSDKNPKDTVRIKYKTKSDVQKTIRKLERLYKKGKISHARNVQITNVMTQRLRVIKKRNPKIDKGRLSLSRKYFNKLKKRTKSNKKKSKRQKTKKGSRKSRRRKTRRRKTNRRSKRYRMQSLASLSSRRIVSKLKGGINERLDSVNTLNIPYVSKQTIIKQLLSDKEKIKEFVETKNRIERNDIFINNYIFNNQLDKVKIVLKYYSEYVNAQDHDLDTGLMRASSIGHIEIIELLINAGADVNAQNEESATALIEASYIHNNLEVIRLLINAGANVNAQDYDGNTPVIIASKRGNLGLLGLLINADANVNAQDYDGNTPVIIASKMGNIELLDLLINAGADPNIQNNYSDTALTNAIIINNTEMVKLLLKSGADPNIKNEDKNTAPLIKAIIMNNTEIVKLLLKSGADSNIKNKDKNTALILASRYNRIENVRLLLKGGANPNIKNKDKNTALTYASNNGHTEIVNLLRQAGAEFN